MIINFASHIFNRAYQLKETLGENLGLLLNTPHKLVLVDFQSNDEIKTVISPYLNHPNFYYKIIDEPYNIGRAKNLSSISEECDYIFNLDADNFISTELIGYIEKHPDKIIRSTDGKDTSTGGRLGFPKRIFLELDGYPVLSHYLMAEDEAMMMKVHQYYPRLFTQTNLLHCRSPVSNSPRDVTDRLKLRNENILEFKARGLFIPHRKVHLKKNLIQRQGGLLQNHEVPWRSTPLTYCFKFSSRFDFSLGGKLPGIGTGIGRHPPYGGAYHRGWSARLMWREHGQSELYFYRDDRSEKFGQSILFPIQFEPEVEYTVQYVVEDGKLTVCLNGHSIVVDLNIPLYNYVLYHVYRGGSSLEWASPQCHWVQIYQKHKGVKQI